MLFPNVKINEVSSKYSCSIPGMVFSQVNIDLVLHYVYYVTLVLCNALSEILSHLLFAFLFARVFFSEMIGDANIISVVVISINMCVIEVSTIKNR